MFGQLPGVMRTEVGYTGGENTKPDYGSVCAGDGHTEALKIVFDPAVISYERLLEVFWSLHNPSQRMTEQYKSAIWPQTSDQARIAAAVIAAKEKNSALPIFTDLEAPKKFYKAESYHQNYKSKNRLRWGLVAVYFLASNVLPPGTVPQQALLVQVLGGVIFASYLPQLLSVFEKFF